MSTIHRVLTVLLAKDWDTVGLEVTSYSDTSSLDVRNQHLAATAKQIEHWLTNNYIVTLTLRYQRTHYDPPQFAKVKLRSADPRQWESTTASASGFSYVLDAAIAQVTAVDWSTAPVDATHVGNTTNRWYKAGPNEHARMWSEYKGKPAWVASTSVRNTLLGNTTTFTPRPEPEESVEPETDGLSIYLSKYNMTTDSPSNNLPAVESRPMKVVMCAFPDTPDGRDKEYAYWAPADAKAGDYGVIYASKNIVQSRDMPFAVVRITQDEVLDTSKATKALLGTFNEDFAKHVEGRIQHMASVRTKLALKKKAFEEGAFYEMMAKNDPEAAALLDELKQFRM